MNDKTLCYASQIAYFQFNDDLYDQLKQGKTFTLQQAFETYATDIYDDVDKELSRIKSEISTLESSLYDKQSLIDGYQSKIDGWQLKIDNGEYNSEDELQGLKYSINEFTGFKIELVNIYNYIKDEKIPPLGRRKIQIFS